MKKTTARNRIRITTASLMASIAAVALPTAQATTRVWEGPVDGQYNNFNNWNPTGTWANGDTLRYNGTVTGNLDLIHTGGQNTGVLLDFTADQTGTVGIRLANEASGSRNWRVGNINNTTAIAIAEGAGKVTLDGQTDAFRLLVLFGTNQSAGGVLQRSTINNAGTLEFGAFTTMQRANGSQDMELILTGGGETTVLGEIGGSLAGFGTGLGAGIRVQGDSVLTLSGNWTANTRLMVDEGRADFTSAAAIGTNSAWNSIRIGSSLDSGTLRYTGSGDEQVDRRIQIGNGGAVNQTGSAIIENTSATGKLVFGNSIFNANGADTLSFGNANTAAARTLTLGGSNTLANEITGQIIDNSATGMIGVIKEGAGRWILSGANTYTGATQVNEGGLIIDGSTAAASAVSVASGALIGGNGTIGGDLTLNNGALFAFDPTVALTVSGAVTLNDTFGVGSLRNADGTAIDWGSVADDTYTLINTSSTFANITNFGADKAFDIGGGRSAYFKDGSLQLVVIPEPATLGLVGVAFLGLFAFRRIFRA